jgi:hydroxyacylglutathione hydrolase
MTINKTSSVSDNSPIRIRPLQAFNDNYIWLIDDGHFACVVDPGAAAPVIQMINQERLKLTHILLTHHHYDHVGGVNALVQAYGAQVWGPAGEVLPQCDHALIENDQVLLDRPNIKLNVLDIPGHTAGHIAFTGLMNEQPVVFCGDTLFAGGCGRIFEGTPAQMLTSLCKLAQLSGETRVYCAHEYTLANLKFALAVEPHNEKLIARYVETQTLRRNQLPTVPSTISDERATNPFLRSEEPEVYESAQQYQAHAKNQPLETFTILRNWKNNF